ncbi:MAG: hypothetical protein SFY32_02015 [Bacteroidota bacterium]|nr:hypothetical protein [Bacteroidota bacterium]
MKTNNRPAKSSKAALEEKALLQQKLFLRRIKLYPPTTWKAIEKWGRETENLTLRMQSVAFTISGRVRTNSNFEGLEVQNGIAILDMVAEKAPELLIEVEPKTFPNGPKLPSSNQMSNVLA